MRTIYDIDENSDGGQYLLRCARIRGVSATALIRRLIDMIAQDHLAPSILDDHDSMTTRRRYEHPFREHAEIIRFAKAGGPPEPKDCA